VVMSFVIGTYPGPFLRYLEKPVNALVKQVVPVYPIPGASRPATAGTDRSGVGVGPAIPQK